MSVNETMALLHLLKMAITLRQAAEKIAGLDPYGHALEDILPGSDVPTPSLLVRT